MLVLKFLNFRQLPNHTQKHKLERNGPREPLQPSKDQINSLSGTRAFEVARADFKQTNWAQDMIEKQLGDEKSIAHDHNDLAVAPYNMLVISKQFLLLKSHL